MEILGRFGMHFVISIVIYETVRIHLTIISGVFIKGEGISAETLMDISPEQVMELYDLLGDEVLSVQVVTTNCYEGGVK